MVRDKEIDSPIAWVDVYDVTEKAAIAHAVLEKGRGGCTVEVRILGTVIIDGKKYSWDRVIRVRAKRHK